MTEVDTLLEGMLVDAHGDDEQLWALREGIEEGLDLPMDVHVVGEPLSLIAVDYDGNPRRGLTARCLRDDGREACSLLLTPPETQICRGGPTAT